jgi:hypothetical protein
MCQSCQGTMSKVPSLFFLSLFFCPPQKKKKKNIYTLHPLKGVWKIHSILSRLFFFFSIRISPLSANRLQDHNPENPTIMHNKRLARTHYPGSNYSIQLIHLVSVDGSLKSRASHGNESNNLYVLELPCPFRQTMSHSFPLSDSF